MIRLDLTTFLVDVAALRTGELGADPVAPRDSIPIVVQYLLAHTDPIAVLGAVIAQRFPSI